MKISCMVACMSILTACAPTTRLDKFEDQLDTDSKLKFEFHRIVDDPNGLGLRFPGLVFGFEKADRDLIGCPGPDDAAFAERVKLERVEGGKPASVRSKLEDRLDDGKCIFLTHVVEYRKDQAREALDAHFLYRSVYPDPFSDPEGPEEPANGLRHVGQAYAESWRRIVEPVEVSDPGLRKQPPLTEEERRTLSLRGVLAQKLRDYGATHVVLYTMGWNSGQTEALRNVNSLHMALLHAAARGGVSAEAFRPYPVLVTWPSHWPWYFGPISYMNKANDADELGAVFLNAIAHRLILPAAQAVGARTVAIGHSFGARALTRALSSRRILAEAGVRAKWDLLIGLQGAFSINRFAMLRGSWEGAPYRYLANYVRKTVLTWSEHDTANAQAFWSNHAGGESGDERAVEINQGYEELGKERRFDRQKLTKSQDVARYAADKPQQVLYLNASELVRFGNYVKGGGAHSDIYTEEMGRVLLALIERFAR